MWLLLQEQKRGAELSKDHRRKERPCEVWVSWAC